MRWINLMYLKNQKGISLIELLAVIVILAIIAAISIPSLSSIIQNQRDKAIVADITALIATARIALVDNSCEDLICEYSLTNNELGFSSTKFTKGTVDFTDGKTPEKIKINVFIEPDVFKGRNAVDYKALIQGGFSEQELLDALAK